MRALNEQDHYEVLEVARDATSEEIERAYRIAREAYDADSLALYSVFDECDAAVIRDRVEEAHRVLCDPEARSAYDDCGAFTADSGIRRQRGSAPSGPEAGESRVRGAEELPGTREAFGDLDAEVDEEEGDFDGAKLRRARMRRGIELEQIADVTKVSTTNLRHLEDENFDDLPATVYVRGFVSAYARSIGLDPGHVVTGYLVRVERARADQGRSRFLGRR